MIQRRITVNKPTKETLESMISNFGKYRNIFNPTGVWTSTQYTDEDGILTSEWEEDGCTLDVFPNTKFDVYQMKLSSDAKIFKVDDQSILEIIKNCWFRFTPSPNEVYIDIDDLQRLGYDGIHYTRRFSFVPDVLDIYDDTSIDDYTGRIKLALYNHLSNLSTESMVLWNWKYDSVELIKTIQGGNL